jgi:hypothetical protein
MEDLMKAKHLKKSNLAFWGILLVIFSSLTFHLEAVEQKGKTAAQYPPAKHFQVTTAASKIKIDAVLDEEAWQKAVKIDLLYEYYPGDNIPAPVKTECLITFSRSKLYVAFRCFDPEPGQIRAHLMNRDIISTFIQDDYVWINLDSFNDERRAFHFRVNPFGVQVDGIYSPVDQIEDYSWDAIWNSAGKITDFGYVIEIAIPFNQLRFTGSKEKQTWGFSAVRAYPRNVRHLFSSHINDRNRYCVICQYNKITGFEGISPGNNIEFDPTLTFTRTDLREDFPTGNMEPGKLKVEPGITAKWGITPNLVLNATVNPDFSHVEADAAQLEVNTQFDLRYPEKRPFFLEGVDSFLTPLEVVFTRTVINPVWGLKNTGKIGKNTLGIFVTQDRYNRLIFPSNQGSTSTILKDDTYSGVLRYRRDVGKGSTVGLLYTGRASENYYNHVLGIDGFFRLTRRKALKFQFLRSETKYPDAISRKFNQTSETFGGNALFVQLKHISRNFSYRFEYENLSPNFRADYGFVPRVDTRRIKGELKPTWWGKRGSLFSKMILSLSYQRVTDHDNNLANQDIDLYLRYEGPLQTVLIPAITRTKELYNGIIFDLTYWGIYSLVKPIGGLKLFFYSLFGDTVDYSNTRVATTFHINPAIEIGIGKHLNINLNHIYERLSLKGEKIYNANLLQARFIYNFNVKTYFRVILQYLHLDRNIDLYITPRAPLTKTLFTQFLFSYKLNPKTVLFIGYSDNHLGLQGIDITRTDRTFFLKIGYALAL